MSFFFFFFFSFQKRLPRHGDISIALNNELREIQLKFGSKRNLKKKKFDVFQMNGNDDLLCNDNRIHTKREIQQQTKKCGEK